MVDEMLPSITTREVMGFPQRVIDQVQFCRCLPNEPFEMPRRSYNGDAGFDLACSEPMRIEPGQIATVRTNIAVALPHGIWAMITGRSSSFHKLGMITNTGIIDNGYRGELVASVWNSNKDKYITVQVGTRLVQLIMFPLIVPVAVEVDVLPPSARGKNGFGSTGV